MDGVKSWEEVQCIGDRYTPRTGHATVLCSDQLFLFGGIDDTTRQQDLWTLDIASSHWTRQNPRGPVPAPRSGVQATVLDEDIYFFGGYTKKHGEYFNDLFKYSVADVTFTEVQVDDPKPLPRTDHTFLAYGACLYSFAGFNGRERLNDLWEFCPRTASWKLLDGEINPDPRFGHSAVIYRDRLIIFGGWNGIETLNDVWSFSLTAFKWTRLMTSGYIAPRYRHSALMCGNSIFIFGGVNKDQVRFADVYELNMGLRHWIRVETRGKQPSPRTFHRAVLHDGFMYILGGFDGQRQNDMYRLYLQDLSPEEDIESNPMIQMKAQDCDEPFCWQVLLPQGAIFSKRTGHSAVALNGFFYVFGGTDEINRRNDLYRFDISIKAWAQIPALGQLPKARSGARGAAQNTFLYFFGGYTKKDGEYFNDLHRFNIQTLEWDQLASSSPPSPRTDHTMILYEDSLYLFGGYDGKNKFNDLHEFLPSTSEWRLINATGMVPLPRFGHSAVVCGRSMFMFGGWDGHDTLDDLYEYSFPNKKWRELMDATGTKPSPRYRHSTVAYHSALYVFAGVDKMQNRYNDLHRYLIPKKEWELIRASGQIPSPRTFHKALLHEDSMYILGGFDGKRQNDMYTIKLSGEERFKRQDSTFSKLADIEEDVDSDENDLLRHYRKQVQVLTDQIKEMDLRLKKEEQRDICQLCYERTIDTVLLECAHRYMCFRCSTSLRTCPVCRQEIVRVVKTYQAY